MEDTIDGGGGIAWRLLATLEGGSLLLATSALLVYTARTKVMRKRRHRNINSVIITDSSNPLGQHLKQKLEARGCTVYTRTNAAIHEADGEQVDALVVIGAETNNGLNGLTRLVSEDVNNNLNLLESISPMVKHGGYIAWACAGTADDSFDLTNVAFDAVLQASVQHIASISHCKPIWVGRCASAEGAADKILAALLPLPTDNSNIGYPFRIAVKKISEYIDRWWTTIN